MKYQIELPDGSKMDIEDLVKGPAVEAVMELLKAKGVLDEKGDLVMSLKQLPSSFKTDAQEKAAGYEDSANFVKFIGIPKAHHAKFGVKAIDTTTGSMGYTVPTALASSILENKQKIAVMRGRAFEFDMAGKFDLPTEGTGVTGYWVGENTPVTESSPTVGKASLDDYYVGSLCKLPWKLLQTSAYNITQFIGKLSAKALSEKEETEFIAGAGTTKPTGLRVTVTADTGMAGASLVYNDLLKLWYSLPAKYRQNAVFFTSSLGALTIHQLKDGENRPLFPVGMPLDQLFNKPLLESEDIPANLGTGAQTELFIGDPFYYWIKNGQGLEMAAQDVIENLQTKIVVYQAVDGKVVLADAFRRMLIS